MHENLNMWDRADKIFNDNRKEIINLYKNGTMTVIQLENKFGISHSAIDRKLRKNGIEIIDRRYKNQILTWRNKKNEIIKDYQNGLSLEQLKKKYNISVFLSRKNFRRNEIKLRGRSFGKIINLEPNENLFYIIGVLYGDGSAFCYDSYPNKKYKVCRIMLDCKDLDFARAFQNSCKKIGLKARLNKKKKITFKQGFCWRVDCYSKILYDFYRKFDLNSMLDEKRKHKIAFIRGIFDSEGSNYINHKKGKYGITITTIKKDFSLFLKEIINSIGLEAKTYHHYNQKTGYTRETHRVWILGNKEKRNNFLKIINSNIARKRILH